MNPVPVDHPILGRLYRQLMVIHDRVEAPMIRDIAQSRECVEFTDDAGDWEIVVRRIEGGRE